MKVQVNYQGFVQKQVSKLMYATNKAFLTPPFVSWCGFIYLWRLFRFSLQVTIRRFSHYLCTTKENPHTINSWPSSFFFLVSCNHQGSVLVRLVPVRFGYQSQLNGLCGFARQVARQISDNFPVTRISITFMNKIFLFILLEFISHLHHHYQPLGDSVIVRHGFFCASTHAFFSFLCAEVSVWFLPHASVKEQQNPTWMTWVIQKKALFPMQNSWPEEFQTFWSGGERKCNADFFSTLQLET